MAETFVSLLETTTTGSLGTVGTNLFVDDTSRFPASPLDNFYITVFDPSFSSAAAAFSAGMAEIMRVTAKSGTSLTVVRGQEGTNAIAIGVGWQVIHVFGPTNISNKILTSSIVDGFAGGTSAPGSAENDKVLNETKANLEGGNEFSGNQILLDNLKVGNDLLRRTERSHFEGAGFDPADIGEEAVYIVTKAQAGGVGVYGAGISFNRVDGNVRRRAAIVPKQTGENNNHIGLAFFINPSTGSSNDIVSERVVIDHVGNVAIDESLDVVGSISKGSGSFLIDHPLDLEKDLFHGFVEAPRYDLIYRGVATLENGQAEVSIDEASNMSEGTFDALTKNAIVTSLQNQDSFARVKPSAISSGKFTIECEDENSTDEIAWVVIAERDDAFVRNEDSHTGEDGSLIVEWDKEDPKEVEIEGGTTTAVRENRGKKGFPRHAKSHGIDEKEIFSDEGAYQAFQREKEEERRAEMEEEKRNIDNGEK